MDRKKDPNKLFGFDKLRNNQKPKPPQHDYLLWGIVLAALIIVGVWLWKYYQLEKRLKALECPLVQVPLVVEQVMPERQE